MGIRPVKLLLWREINSVEEDRKGVMKERSPSRKLSEASRLTSFEKLDVGSVDSNSSSEGFPVSSLELKSISSRIGKFESITVGKEPVRLLRPRSMTWSVKLWIERCLISS